MELRKSNGLGFIESVIVRTKEIAESSFAGKKFVKRFSDLKIPSGRIDIFHPHRR